MAKDKRGGRSGSSTASNKNMNVPYESWGKEISNQEIRDDSGSIIGYIDDETLYITEPDITPISKKQMLDDIKAYKNDDGTYGDNDTFIYATYEDGSTWSNDDKTKFKKSGIIGLAVSTGDYQSAWGEDFVGSGRNKRRVPMTTSATDEVPELSNSYVGYKTTGAYKQRVKTTYNNWDEKRQKYYTKREILRKSTVKEM